MNNPYLCPIWNAPATVTAGQGDFADVVSTSVPGRYRITGSARATVSHLTPRDKAKLTTWIINQQTLGEANPVVTVEVVEEAKRAAQLGIVERCDRLMIALTERLPEAGGEFLFNGAQTKDVILQKAFARAWSECVHDHELADLFRMLVDNGLARTDGTSYVLKFEGWKRLEEIRLRQVASSQAFVAMWFDGSMTDAYEHGIKIAVENLGYAPMRIDNKEHANKIDDEIIAEIRRSKFVVADFTSEADKPRGGVYYEAGFAMGLALPVIWSCRSDMIQSVHFDTRQFNHITWDTPDDLRTKLEKRIGAVIGDGPLPKPTR